MDWFEDILGLIISGKIKTPEQLHRAKLELCKKHGLDRIPKNSEILALVPVEHISSAKSLLYQKVIYQKV